MKKVKPIDYVWNNPRANRQFDNMDISKDEKEKFNNNMMLYDEKSKSDRRLDLIKRMVKSYNSKVEKEKPTSLKDNEPKSAADKRAIKILDLMTRKNSWLNLR